jgi:hypothetical protein
MTKMYLLWEWTEEREAKIHHGIFSAREKAEAAALERLRRDIIEIGGEPDEVAEAQVNWDEGLGVKVLPEDSEEWMDDENTPYEIEEFEVDTLTFYQYFPEKSSETVTF